jgi:hypothetical protein
MKKNILATVLMLTVGSNVSFAGNPKSLKGKELSKYALAVSISFSNSNLNCLETGESYTRAISQYPLFAEKGSIDSLSDQPLLTFERDHFYGEYSRGMKMTVTSTPDYKKIQSLVIEIGQRISVNQGDLRNPKITEEWEVFGKVECK